MSQCDQLRQQIADYTFHITVINQLLATTTDPGMIQYLNYQLQYYQYLLDTANTELHNLIDNGICT